MEYKVLSERDGDAATALAHFSAAANDDPSYAEAHFDRGLMKQRLGRPDLAALSYRTAAALDPSKVEYLSCLG